MSLTDYDKQMLDDEGERYMTEAEADAIEEKGEYLADKAPRSQGYPIRGGEQWLRVVDDRVLYSAPSFGALVHVLNMTRNMRPEGEDTDQQFMDGVAERANMGMAEDDPSRIRSDTAQHFIRDCHDRGIFVLLKREWICGA